MHSDNSKIQDIFTDLSFSEDEIKIIDSVFQKVMYKKGDIIAETDDNIHTQYYILEGCLRFYHIDQDGKEHTIQFAINDWWISDFTGFFSSSKSIMKIEVLRDAILYRLTEKDKEFLFARIPQIESFFRKKLERAFGAFQKRILSNLSQTATERYIDFINTYPNIEQCVKNYHIASYLGITTESLSRIRKELVNN